jgi:hypothetical protein
VNKEEHQREEELAKEQADLHTLEECSREEEEAEALHKRLLR